MSVIEMPKTYSERLAEIEVNKSILINANSRQIWANSILFFKKKSSNVYSIRTSKETGEIRVWRLK